MRSSKILDLHTIAVLTLAALGACGGGSGEGGGMPTKDIKTVMEAHVDELMAIDGVSVVAIGELDDRTPCIKVYVVEKTEEHARRIPKMLEGYPVVVEVSGVIEPMSDDG